MMNAKNIRENFLHKELNYAVNGCAFDAFKEVGIGFDETIYHKIFHHKLIQKGLKAEYKPPVYVEYFGKNIVELEVDEIVEKKILVELKCIRKDFIPDNYAQILTYLKVTGMTLGLLVNFGLHKVATKRVLYQPDFIKNRRQWDDDFYETFSEKPLVDKLVELIYKVDKALGPSYLSKIYKTALIIELNQSGIEFNPKTTLTILASGHEFPDFEIDYWLIEPSFLLGILAGNERPRTYDFLRMRSYLKKLNLHHGVIAFWSRKNLQLYGIYES